MKPQICVCCGEPIHQGQELSRNPNVCASCSSMADGMDERGVEGLEPATAEPPPKQAAPRLPPYSPTEEVVLDWTSGRLSRRTAELRV